MGAPGGGGSHGPLGNPARRPRGPPGHPRQTGTAGRAVPFWGATGRPPRSCTGGVGFPGRRRAPPCPLSGFLQARGATRRGVAGGGHAEPLRRLRSVRRSGRGDNPGPGLRDLRASRGDPRLDERARRGEAHSLGDFPSTGSRPPRRSRSRAGARGGGGRLAGRLPRHPQRPRRLEWRRHPWRGVDRSPRHVCHGGHAGGGRLGAPPLPLAERRGGWCPTFESGTANLCSCG